MAIESQERRIIVFGAGILAGVILISGFVIFRIMQHQGEAVLGRQLQFALQSRAHLFDTEINTGARRALTIVTRPFLIQQLHKLNQDPRDQKAALALRRAMRSFLTTGFSALAIETRHARTVASAGMFPSTPAIALPLAGYRHTKLEWRHGLILRMKLEIERKGRPLGYLFADAPLQGLDGVLLNVSTLGPSAELAVCGSGPKSMKCLPTRLHPTPLPNVPKRVGGQLLPMARALNGKAGVQITRDYRNREVVAAYTPLAGTGLGMVLKLDAHDLYAPIWQTLPYIVPALAVLVLSGLLLLHWLVAPLVRDVVASEAEARQSQARLHNSETRLRTLFDSVDDGIVVADSRGTIEAFNPGAERIFGYSSSDIIGQNVSFLMPDPDHSKHDSFIARYLDRGDSILMGNGREVLGQRRNGEQVPLDLHLNEMYLDHRRVFVATMRDVTERKRSEARVVHMATHDALTDLPNRHLFLERTDQALMRAERERSKVAVLFLDLDGFKQVNDTRGHDAGDLVLIEVARRVRALLRKEDILARQGGDEFIVALPHIADAGHAELVAQKIIDVVGTPYDVGGEQVRIGVSIGIGLYPDDGESVSAVLKHADTAMYSAKSAGGAGVRLQ
ncbi:MAG: diguanylate cyclase [Gammaproteobacteria bacterium]